MITQDKIDNLLAGKATVTGTNGEKIGSVGQIYVDDATGNPTWVTANTGLFGLKETFIPLDQAEATDDEIRVPYSKDRVKDAPNLDPNGHIAEDEQDRLYEYYGLGNGNGTSAADQPTTAGGNAAPGAPGAAGGAAAGAAGGAGFAAGQGTADHRDAAAGRDDAADRRDPLADRDAAGARPDAAAGRGTAAEGRDDPGSLTRSEEQVNVGTERQATGKVRLRKYVVTENVTKTVPVSREEVRVEREPITEADRAAGGTTPQLGDDEQEVTLHEETPVVEKRTVPVEKVRLEKDQITDEETVNTEVRKEQIDTETDDPRGL